MINKKLKDFIDDDDNTMAKTMQNFKDMLDNMETKIEFFNTSNENTINSGYTTVESNNSGYSALPPSGQPTNNPRNRRNRNGGKKSRTMRKRLNRKKKNTNTRMRKNK